MYVFIYVMCVVSRVSH